MDLREYIQLLSSNGLLTTINKCVDWRYEIGKISRGTKNRALLFKNIKDYSDYSLFTGGFADYKNVATLFGLPSATPKVLLLSELKSRIGTPIEPREVVSNENFIWSEGNVVNLFRLPVPWWHPLDGGRYVGTWHINVSKDPQTKKRNVGVYRMQIIDKKSATISVAANSHLALHIKKAEESGKNLQVAVGIGVDETVVLAAASGVSENVDEYTLAGAIGRAPVRLTKCKTVDLEMPLHTEIVLEGVICKGVRVQDGPFFDYTGKVSINKKAYCFEVNAIRTRVNPVFRGMSVGMAGAEDHLLFSMLSHLDLVNFHGSSLRQKLQNYFLKNELYHLFQLAGKVGSIVPKKEVQ